MLKTKQEQEPLFLNINETTTIKTCDNTLSPRQYDRRKRDSGYGTDFSPASVTALSRRFTFDSDLDGSEFDFSGEFGSMDINNDVFSEEIGSDTCISKLCDDSDDADREVEDLLNDSGELGETNSVSEPIKIGLIRPTAPIPSPEEIWDDLLNNNYYKEEGEFSEHGANPVEDKLGNICRRCRQCSFRPISCSVGAQTPFPHSHMTKEDLGGIAKPRFQPYALAKGSAVNRLRHRSDNENSSNDHAPDVEPLQRDRSYSLPYIPGLRQPYEYGISNDGRRKDIGYASDSASNNDRKRQSSIQRVSSFTVNTKYVQSVSVSNDKSYLPATVKENKH